MRLTGRFGTGSFAVGLVGALLLAVSTTAARADDEVAFGTRLLETGHTRLARVCFERLLADDARTDEERLEARHGLALVLAVEAEQRRLRHPADAAGAAAAAEEAAWTLDAFADANPQSPLGQRARFEACRTRLDFARWVAERWERRRDPPLAALARQRLEAFLATYADTVQPADAHDLQGRVAWIQATEARDPDEAAAAWRDAVAHFEAGLGAPAGSDRAWRGLTEVARDAQKAGQDALVAHVLTTLDGLCGRHETPPFTEDEQFALLAKAELLTRRDRPDAAVACVSGLVPSLDERSVGRLRPSFVARLGRLLANPGLAASGLEASPAVFRAVGDRLRFLDRPRSALAAYRGVILVTADTPTDFLAWRWDAWEGMARAYRGLGDDLGEVFAREPIHEAWMRGWIPQEGPQAEVLGERALSSRRQALHAWEELASRVDVEAFHSARRAVQQTCQRDYPRGTVDGPGPLHEALRLFKEGQSLKDQGDARWVERLDEAYPYFVAASGPLVSSRSDLAWSFRVRLRFLQARYEDALREGEAARQAWEEAAREWRGTVTKAERARQIRLRLPTDIWIARALDALGRHDEVLVRLGTWHAAYAEYADRVYLSLADDLRARAFLAAGRHAEAQRTHATICAEDPTFFRLGALTREILAACGEQVADPLPDDARAAEGPTAARLASLLEPRLTKDPRQTEDLKAYLAGERVVVAWTDVRGERWEVLVPRPRFGPELRGAVERLEVEDPGLAQAIGELRQRLRDDGDESLERWVRRLQEAPFDPLAFSRVANTDPALRLALAWVWAQSDDERERRMARTLRATLLEGPLAETRK